MERPAGGDGLILPSLDRELRHHQKAVRTGSRREVGEPSVSSLTSCSYLFLGNPTLSRSRSCPAPFGLENKIDRHRPRQVNGAFGRGAFNRSSTALCTKKASQA